MLELCEVITELLIEGRPVHFTATGQSMLPLISSGAILHVISVYNSINYVGAGLKPARMGYSTPNFGYYVGEMVLLKSPGGGILAHRLVNRKSLQTRGDNSQHLDPPGEIIGRVIGIEQNGSYCDLNYPFWQNLNRVIGFASALQLGIGTSYQQSPNFLKLLGRKMATAIFRGLLRLACLGYRTSV